MKTLIALTLALTGMAANAFDFSPGPTYSCGTYCTGYVTTDPAYSLAYVNLNYVGGATPYRVTIGLNGVNYQGFASTPDAGGALFNTNNDGTFVTISSISYTYKHTCTHSGRGQHCTSWYYIASGTVTP